MGGLGPRAMVSSAGGQRMPALEPVHNLLATPLKAGPHARVCTAEAYALVQDAEPCVWQSIREQSGNRCHRTKQQITRISQESLVKGPESLRQLYSHS